MRAVRRFGRLIGRGGSIALWLLLSVSVAVVQAADCPAYVDQALNTVGEICSAVGRNQVCYGNSAVNAEFDAGAGITFVTPGDRAEVFDLQRLATAPLRPDDGVWGVAVLALQANLPDSLPGENVTFIVFGDTEVTPAASAAGFEAPMQAFSLSTRITGIDCAEVPESGLLVQVPQETTVSFLINGVEVKVGSSAFLQTDADDLTVDTVEGMVEVTSDGTTEVAGEGVTVRVRRGQRPQRAILNRSARVRNAPWRLLPRLVRAFPPPPDGQPVDLNQCVYANTQRAAQNPVSARAGEAVVLRFTIPQESIELARIIQRQTRNQLFINGAATPPYTRIGPWRGETDDDYGGALGIQFYWLLDAPAAGDYRIALDSESLTGRPIMTGIDGPDPDNAPEIIPPRRRIYCLLRVQM